MTGEEAVLVRLSTAARLCSISRSRAYQLARAGRLPGALRLAGTWRVNVRALEAWADAAAASAELERDAAGDAGALTAERT